MPETTCARSSSNLSGMTIPKAFRCKIAICTVRISYIEPISSSKPLSQGRHYAPVHANLRSKKQTAESKTTYACRLERIAQRIMCIKTDKKQIPPFLNQPILPEISVLLLQEKPNNKCCHQREDSSSVVLANLHRHALGRRGSRCSRGSSLASCRRGWCSACCRGGGNVGGRGVQSTADVFLGTLLLSREIASVGSIAVTLTLVADEGEERARIVLESR